jgi:serine/threonine-protein kinase RsbW
MHRHDRNVLSSQAPAPLGLEDQVRRVQASTVGALGPVLEKVEDWMRFLGYPNRDIFSVKLSLHEAVTNAVRHGNGHDPKKYVQISYLVTPTQVLVEVADQGLGFDPAQVPEPLSEPQLCRGSGRGLFLMRAYMTWVSYNREGNQVTLCKHRSDLS